MSLYPSLEDMKVDQLARAQVQMATQAAYFHQPRASDAPSAPLPYPTSPVSGKQSEDIPHAYPSLGDYMGIEFTPEVLAANMPEYLSVAQRHDTTVANPTSPQSMMIAPISGSDAGFQKSQITHGIRSLVLCKGADGKIGMRVKDINKGVFVSLVMNNSPAAMAGLKFGDQILQINGKNVAGMSMEGVHDLLRKAPSNNISVAVRDRPFERTITLHKDSTNHVGFHFRDGEVTALIKDSSAARNGLLTNHHLLEVNGQNVVGLKDKEITEIINNCGSVLTITILPSFLYKHIVKNMASSLITKLMDHSSPDL